MTSTGAKPGKTPRAAVTGYGLGIFVEPDDPAAITAGLQRLIADPPATAAAFACYNSAASWQANIDGLARLLRAL